MNLEIMNINNVPVPAEGYGYMFIDAADNKLKIKKTNSVIEYTNTLDDVQLLNLTDYSAFEVYAHDTEIPAGALTSPHLEYIGKEGDTLYTTVPASMTESFCIRSTISQEKQDVVVDWGDGSVTTLCDITPELLYGSEYRYTITHTYGATGVYKVQIFGKSYYGICSLNESDPNRYTHNLMCRCLAADLPLATCVINLASFAKQALMLLHVDAPSFMLSSRISVGSLFYCCKNLISVKGFSAQIISTNTEKMFSDCYQLTECDFVFPTINSARLMRYTFHRCYNLSIDIATLIPSGGFSTAILNADHLFYACQKLTGTVPADQFWNNQNVKWLNTDSVFTGCSEEIRAQAPVSWGGTASDNIIEKSLEEKYNDLLARIETLENK